MEFEITTQEGKLAHDGWAWRYWQWQVRSQHRKGKNQNLFVILVALVNFSKKM